MADAFRLLITGSGYVYRVTFTPTGAAGEGIDRDEAVAALAVALGVKSSSEEEAQRGTCR